MHFERQHTETVVLNHISEDELAKILIKLINSNRKVRKAIINLAFSCPNIVTQI